jgi:cupin fold WbuC family metalloprotein
MKMLNRESLDALVRQAQDSPRRRAHQTLHVELDDAVQRLAIAMEPETYVRPHRHPQSWELLTRLRGRFAILFFDEAGTVTLRTELGEDQQAIEYPAGAWHSVVSLEPGSVIFEVKRGPYIQPTAADAAAWAPAENEPGTAAALAWFRTAGVGERLVSGRG